MAIQILEPAATWRLTTLERLKAEVGITDTDDDDVLDDMISRSSQIIARECRRTFGLQKVAETLPGSGAGLLELSQVPIWFIDSIYEDSEALASSVFSIEDADVGAVYRADGWGATSALRAWGVEAYASGYILPGRVSYMRYIATYWGGYILPAEANPFLPQAPSDPQLLPGAIEQACLETVKAWYENREGSGTANAQSVAIGQLRVSYKDQAAATQQTAGQSLPPVALGLIRNYVRLT